MCDSSKKRFTVEYYLFCLYDRVADKFLAPFHAHTAAEAVRFVRNQFKDPQSMPPEEFELLYLGSLESEVFDDIEMSEAFGSKPRSKSVYLRKSVKDWDFIDFRSDRYGEWKNG